MQHTHILKQFDSYCENKKVPNIILYGASGCGKSTLINYLLNKIYCDVTEENKKKSIMYVNCKHFKSGIFFIRDELKTFATTTIITPTFKSIILYNGDFLTTDAQSALRRCIELYSQKTRFFITAECKDKLLFPILSRFCDIYVPYKFTNNLYLKDIYDKFPEYRELETKKIKILSGLITKFKIKQKENTDTENIGKEIMEYAIQMYNNGYSGLDLISMLDNHNYEMDVDVKYKLMFEFNEMRVKYFDEILFMSYQLTKILENI